MAVLMDIMMCLIRMIIHSDRKMASERRIRIFFSSVFFFFFNKSIFVDDATLYLQKCGDFEDSLNSEKSKFRILALLIFGVFDA